MPPTSSAADKAVPPALKKIYAQHTLGRMPGHHFWPTELWSHPFRHPGYKKACIFLAVIVLASVGLSAVLAEIGTPLGVFHETFHRWVHLRFPLIFGWTIEAAWILLKALAILTVILLNALFLVWWERKISAHMQSRLGPIFTGGWHGWLQTAADAAKLLIKEDTGPKQRDRWLHLLAPVLTFVPVLACFAAVPFGKNLEAANLDAGILYIFAWAGVSVLGIIVAGWASANKYSLLGGLRCAAQMVSYELPRSFSIVPVLAIAGSLSLTRLVEFQQGYWFGVVPKWFIFYPVVGQISFIIFLIASVAETNRVPFDIPEAESELVGGFHTEYSGMKFALFFLTEYAYVFLASALMATFFFGGGSPPLAFLSFVPSWFWFLSKTIFFVFCFMWFRWTFPRFRVDRMMDFTWKFLLPWSFVNILLAAPYLFIK